MREHASLRHQGVVRPWVATLPGGERSRFEPRGKTSAKTWVSGVRGKRWGRGGNGKRLSCPSWRPISQPFSGEPCTVHGAPGDLGEGRGKDRQEGRREGTKKEGKEETKS